jgi:hypothetical protein
MSGSQAALQQYLRDTLVLAATEATQYHIELTGFLGPGVVFGSFVDHRTGSVGSVQFDKDALEAHKTPEATSRALMATLLDARAAYEEASL